MSRSNWLAAGIVPGVEREPSKKLKTDTDALLELLEQWRQEAEKTGHRIKRIVVAYEAGLDGFWLARYLHGKEIETHVIHASSVAVSREHRRAKTDRLDTEMLKRAFLGWLRGERNHCKMAAIPTLAEEDARRPNRERERLVCEQTRIVSRMESAFIRLGILDFNPKNKGAADRLDGLLTPDGEPIPPNTLASLRRDFERKRLVQAQIKELEQVRLERLAEEPDKNPMPWSTYWHASSASILRPPTSGSLKFYPAICAIAAPLVNQNDASLIPDQYLDPVGALGAEHESRAAERIEAHRLLHDKRQTVDALPEVCRVRDHIDAQSASRRDHGDAARIAGIVLVNRASSMSADTRRITPSTTSSILHDFAPTPRFFRLREGRVGLGSTTSAANTGSFAVSAGKASTPAFNFLRQS